MIYIQVLYIARCSGVEERRGSRFLDVCRFPVRPLTLSIAHHPFCLYSTVITSICVCCFPSSVNRLCRTNWLRKDLHVVLVHPQIPQNTGIEPQHSTHVCYEVAAFEAHHVATVQAHTIVTIAISNRRAELHAFYGKMACATVSMQQLLISEMASILTLPCSHCAGSIARTCAATGVGLHLVGPLGFRIDSSRLKRAGLDYWPYVAVNIYATWQVTSRTQALWL